MFLPFVRNGTVQCVKTGAKCVFQQQAGICSKSMRGGPIKRPKPWDYINKRYGVLQGFYDKTSYRFDENSKIIVVDGPPAAGKTAFAKVLAEEFELLHLPEVTMDDYYINPYGYDMRQLDPKLPERARSFDIADFCKTPTHENAATFQIIMYISRYYQYINALRHLLNTGQGVVLERSVFSDMVFVEAMFDAKFVSHNLRKYYYQLRQNSIVFLLKPHLSIYLDVPVAKVQERIKRRAIPYEKDSKVYDTAYLTSIEKYYKESYLKTISEHADILVYDWSEGGDAEVVIEDMERMDFENYEQYGKKMEDWRFLKEWDLSEKRMLYTNLNGRNQLTGYLRVPGYYVPEIMLEALDVKARDEVWFSAPGMKFEYGFNSTDGDGSTLFKAGRFVNLPLKTASGTLKAIT